MIGQTLSVQWSRVALVTAAVLVSTATSGAGVEIRTDIPYTEPAHAEQHLDFYWPTGGATATVVFIHGGGLEEDGERRTSPPYARVCEVLVDNGFACATIDYRLHPTFAWPAMPDDVVSAVVEVRKLVAARGGDIERLFLMGHSSGCALAATVGTNPVFLAKRHLEPRSIAGVIAMGCVLDNQDGALRDATVDDIQSLLDSDAGEASLFGTPENWISSVPSFHISEHTPPTLVVVARGERFFPSILEQGARFVRLALERERPADVVIVPGTHMSSISDLGQPGDPTLGAIVAFLRAPDEAGQDSR